MFCSMSTRSVLEHGQLQQNDLPVLRGVQLVDVAGEGGGAVEAQAAVLAGEALRGVGVA